MATRIKLLHNWKDVLARAWSVRLMIAAALLSGVEVALPYIAPATMPPGLFAALSIVTTAAAFVARFVAQKGLSE